MKVILITGSGGLIGYELSKYYLAQGWRVIGMDNDMRGRIFGPGGSGSDKINQLDEHPAYFHIWGDIRRISEVGNAFHFLGTMPDAIVHCAAQPSHDQSGKNPIEDFEINALGTLNVLETARLYCPQSPFVHMSSSKVYGDWLCCEPELIEELPTRYDWKQRNNPDFQGIDEEVNISPQQRWAKGNIHSPYGASKAASDLMAQEYARYYGMPVMVIRPTNMTGPAHSGVEAHGYLNYLVKCAVTGTPYRIFGYKGKQVRDNIHSDDVVSFVAELIGNPKPAEVYNLGSGKENARSILETILELDSLTGRKLEYTILDQPRRGDHIVYYTDIRKALRDYPRWRITMPIGDTLRSMVEAAKEKYK